MANSNWQINKIGLVDFWYYDEEEFHFEEGRMLLRGANGSGKSVTMQSFIPLLLDGNMRPERLDPFGSRARRMENYLLEENDGREERTGYLYMEFKREDSQTYISIGLGMRARRGKPLDTWYFFLQDGRRIKKDFFLYRQERERVPLSKQELRNRIGEGGRVVESQKEYMAMVNKLIFGFETIEAYKEMVDLLIQLRTPKLSKDFKPTIINEILSNSLMPLSEDDLRPMSEAIENMDGLKTGLDALKESREAARRVERVYDRYNRFMLYEKASVYKKYNNEQQSAEKAIALLEQQIADEHRQYAEAKDTKEALIQEELVRKEERDALGESDAARLKEKETELYTEIERIVAEQQIKQRSVENKRERRIELENKEKDKQNAQEMLTVDIHKCLTEMEDTLSQATFDEFDFMKRDLEENPDQVYNFTSHRLLLERLKNGVDEGVGVLQNEKNVRIRYDDCLKRVEEQQGMRDQKEREVHQHEEQLRGVKNELLEAVHLWYQDAGECQVPEHTQQEIAVQIEQFGIGDDYAVIRDQVRGVWETSGHELQMQHASLKQTEQNWEQQIDEKQLELQEWEQKKDPAPPLTPEMEKSRQALRQKGIDFLEFYKTIDFAEALTAEQANRLEEALLKMGILDALIVDYEDREAILAMDAGMCDKYIFSDIDQIRENLTGIMEIVNEENDILLYHKISNALRGMGYNAAESHTNIAADGHYKLGIITGTITREYQAKYIGVRAREKFRQQMIEKLQAEIEGLGKERDQVRGERLKIEERQRQLDIQWQQFPQGEDLKIAVKSLDEVNEQLKRIIKNLNDEQEQLKKEQKRLNELQIKIQEICGKVYLAPNLEIFLMVQGEITDYQNLLTDLQMDHRTYLEGLASLADIREQIEDTDDDLDILLGDARQLQQSLDKQQSMMQAVKEQLSLTNYEEIKEQLDRCIMRLDRIPTEREACVEKMTELKGTIAQKEREKSDSLEKILRVREKVRLLKEAVMSEVKLGYYAYDLAEDDEDVQKVSEKIIRSEANAFSQMRRDDITGSLQETYHQNRGYLSEYNPIMESVFAELEQEDYPELRFKRLNIMAKYRGINMNFTEFLSRIEQDIEEKMSLLSEKERELFEDILVNIISRKIRAKIYSSEEWVAKMNELMENMQTSSGLTLSLKWKSKRAEHEGQLDTRKLVELLKKDSHWMNEEEFESLSAHFRSKIQEARKLLEQQEGTRSFHALVRDILDYRKWFEFQLEFQKSGEKKKELTDRMFFTFSGGEKAMAMYVPLFSAVVAKYGAARPDAPRLISLDEAFAGVDETNIKDMFRLMVEFRFAFIVNSQILWGDYETVPRLAIYQLLRNDNAKFVTVIPYIWNGKEKVVKV